MKPSPRVLPRRPWRGTAPETGVELTRADVHLLGEACRESMRTQSLVVAPNVWLPPKLHTFTLYLQLDSNRR